MEEAYCSYEVSKLLKKKGFDESTSLVWYEKYPSPNACRRTEIGKTKMDLFYLDERTERSSQYNNTMSIPSYIYGNIFSAPTHQMACAWLRDKGYHIYTFKGVDSWVYEVQSLNDDWTYHLGGFEDHDEAIEAALKYTLEKLI